MVVFFRGMLCTGFCDFDVWAQFGYGQLLGQSSAALSVFALENVELLAPLVLRGFGCCFPVLREYLEVVFVADETDLIRRGQLVPLLAFEGVSFP
jgi:hypothetical protein